MHNHVNWMRDMLDLETLFVAEYEKANIWPAFADRNEMKNVMEEEVAELEEAAKSTVEWFGAFQDNEDTAMDDNLLSQIYGAAAKTVCEALQLIAVCNKCARKHDVQLEAVETVSNWLNDIGFEEASKAIDAEYDL